QTVGGKRGALVSGDPDRDLLVERLAGLLGVAEAASTAETFWAVRKVLELLARKRPIVILLEDVHWGQPMLFDLIEHLVEWIVDAPVLLVALARGELREVREELTSTGPPTVDVIKLEPLDAQESQALVNGVLGGQELTGALIDRVLRASEGNPLFIREMLRMLMDEGVLRHEDDAWVAAGDGGEIEVPPTIHALLAARGERLGAAERFVVERAAIIGKEFYRDAVAQLLPPPVR